MLEETIKEINKKIIEYNNLIDKLKKKLELFVKYNIEDEYNISINNVKVFQKKGIRIELFNNDFTDNNAIFLNIYTDYDYDAGTFFVNRYISNFTSNTYSDKNDNTIKYIETYLKFCESYKNDDKLLKNIYHKFDVIINTVLERDKLISKRKKIIYTYLSGVRKESIPELSNDQIYIAINNNKIDVVKVFKVNDKNITVTKLSRANSLFDINTSYKNFSNFSNNHIKKRISIRSFEYDIRNGKYFLLDENLFNIIALRISKNKPLKYYEK